MMSESCNPGEIQPSTDDDNCPSSSTEGPDSPGNSSSGSPVPMTMHQRASIFHTFTPEDLTNSKLPRYHLEFMHDVIKDGEFVCYRIRVRRLYVDNPDAETPLEIDREYEDFEFLHHNLSINCANPGTIIPPLPSKSSLSPLVDLATNFDVRDGWRKKSSLMLGKYMHSILRHPLLGESKYISDFLEHRNPPIRSKIRKSFLSGVKQSLESRKHSVKDVDEAFQQERDWAALYGAHIRDTKDKFQNVINAQVLLANQIGQLASCLATNLGASEGANAVYNKLNSRFSSVLDKEKSSVEKVVGCNDKTMGAYFSLWTSYLESENTMLRRRTSLMIEKETAAKALQKAKPQNMDQPRALRDEKTKAFSDCSEQAAGEIRRFHQKRLMEMRDSLVEYTEGHIRCAKDAVDGLSNSVMALKSFSMTKINQTSSGEDACQKKNAVDK